MKKILNVFLFLAFLNPVFAQNKFASFHSVALDAVISEGKIVTSNSYDYYLKDEIKEQLMYTIGQLNGLEGGSPDMNRLQTQILKKEEMSDGKILVTYSAKLFIAWPKEKVFPSTFEFIVPKGGGWNDLAKFKKAFGSDEHGSKQCLDYGAHDISTGNFWYYYRPQKYNCSLNRDSYDKNLAVKIKAHLSRSDKNTKDKYPEYEKIWEDGKLIVTAIFGMNDSEVISQNDAGVRAYNQTYSALIQTFGKPLSINVDLQGSQPGVYNKEIRMTFNTSKGILDVALFLVKGIREVDNNFYSSYNERTQISDFVSYSGHSGLGANIRAMAQMGEFSKGQYQIFLVNGCDTFAYVDDALKDAHQEVNPGYGPDKFVDVITNAMPSFFHMNYRANLSVITGIVNGYSYEKILSNFDKSQRANVTGEEDNNWPNSFY